MGSWFSQITLLFTAHVAGDFYAGFYGPLVPFLKKSLGLSLQMTAALQVVFGFMCDLMQPAYGLLGERYGRRRFMVTGIVIAAVAMSCCGLIAAVPWLALMLLFGGLGVGMFHPCGAALAGAAAGRRSTAISLYMAGGTLGLVIAPMVVPGTAQMGMGYVAFLAIPGLLVAAAIGMNLPAEAEHADRGAGGLRELARTYPKLAALHLHVILRMAPLSAYMSFLTLFITLRGMTPVAAGRVFALFLAVGVAGSLTGGYLTDRLPRKPFVVLTELIGCACLVTAPVAHGTLFYATLVIGAFATYAGMPLQVVLAQEIAPRMRSAASGVVMGLAYGVASLLVLPLGALGDRIRAAGGTELAAVTMILQSASLFLLLASAMALFLKMERRPGENDQ